MLKMTGVKLERSFRHSHVLKKGLRGRIFDIANRYHEANNQYMKNYDPKIPAKYNSYHDMNKLYG